VRSYEDEEDDAHEKKMKMMMLMLKNEIGGRGGKSGSGTIEMMVDLSTEQPSSCAAGPSDW
jgi:hypothetical protein